MAINGRGVAVITAGEGLMFEFEDELEQDRTIRVVVEVGIGILTRKIGRLLRQIRGHLAPSGPLTELKWTKRDIRCYMKYRPGAYEEKH